MPDKHSTFKKDLHNALKDSELQKGLKKAITNFKVHRQEALKNIDFCKVQEEIKNIKEKNINQLQKNLNSFINNCHKSGIIVYQTQSGKDTCEKVVEIIKKHNGKKVVKSKSMVCDEIDLNKYLEKNNIEPIETDLGEWIIQLAGEKPSHITAPAIHMTKERVAELMNNKFNVSLPADPKEITKFARKKLREEFINADVGISGANILVAETGSAIIISNEGNARLVSTLPDVHIIVSTCEKFVETMAEAERILNILPKSSTGQNITSYVSIISGPSKTADIEKELVMGVHGPEHVYVILMDNGREAILEDDDFKEVLNCIKCGACLGMCPVYQAVGGHVFGHHYMGGVGAILTTFLNGIEASKDITKLCAGCGICKDICPAGVDTPRMILKLKEQLYNTDRLPLSKKAIIKGLFSHKGIFETTLSAASVFQKIVYNNKDEITKLPGFLSELTSFRHLPTFAKKSFSQYVKSNKVTFPYNKKKTSYIFYTGCLVEKFYPDAGEKAVKLLQSLDFNVLYSENQTCCGIPALYSGDTTAYNKFVDENKRVFDSFKNKSPEGIFTLCPSCTKGIKDQGILDNIHIYDFGELLHGLSKDKELPIKKFEAITYHPSCHYSKDSNYYTHTHLLLKELYGSSFIEYFDMYNCCGAAGSYAIEYPEVSENIIKRKIGNIIDYRAKYIVIDCPGCLMQIQGYINKNEIDLKTLYITDLFEI